MEKKIIALTFLFVKTYNLTLKAGFSLDNPNSGESELVFGFTESCNPGLDISAGPFKGTYISDDEVMEGQLARLINGEDDSGFAVITDDMKEAGYMQAMQFFIDRSERQKRFYTQEQVESFGKKNWYRNLKPEQTNG